MTDAATTKKEQYVTAEVCGMPNCSFRIPFLLSEPRE